jgi:hypothetical protein
MLLSHYFALITMIIILSALCQTEMLRLLCTSPSAALHLLYLHILIVASSLILSHQLELIIMKTLLYKSSTLCPFYMRLSAASLIFIFIFLS